jgi:hypothetical protein
LGAELLDEDQILVRAGSDGSFYGDGWGYQIKEGNSPIRAIFFVVQANEDCLIPLSQVRAARMLLDRFSEVVFLRLSPKMQTQVFVQISSLARGVPAYELYFRKSPDFWKLIDEHFPD